MHPELESVLIIHASPSSAGSDRREFLAGGAVAVLTAMTQGGAAGSDERPEHADGRPKSVQLATGRRIEFWECGKKNGLPCVLVHGFLGSGRTYVGCHQQLVRNGIHAVAPTLYGPTTDWRRRRSVMDAGEDIAALSAAVHGPGVLPVIIGCSGGVKDAIAACIAMNRSDGPKVPHLFLVSGQVDLSRRDAFALLSHNDQFELNALRGVPVEARLPAFQPLRNAGARLKQRVAQRKVGEMAHTQLPAQRIVSKFCPQDQAHLRADESFRTVLFQDASSYSYREIIDSVQKLFGWNLDLRALAGTHVKILHGTHDTLVHPQNASILEHMLRQAGVQHVQAQFFPDGHLLLKVRAEQMLKIAANHRGR